MSQALVSHLILHPQVSQTLRLLSTTVGRDKVSDTAHARGHRPGPPVSDLTHGCNTDLSIYSILFSIDRLVLASFW